MDPALDELLADLVTLGSGSLLVATGAGISAASGIPTFRGSDPEAVWRVSDVTLATREYFTRDPVGQLQWYFGRFEAARRARPNPAHSALVTLEETLERRRSGSFYVVTQNIDTLHEQSGVDHLIKVHGTLDRLRCSRDGCVFGAPTGSMPIPVDTIERFRRAPSVETLPGCDACGANLRAHVLFFDEHYYEHADYRFTEVEELASSAAVILFVGTSFSVGVTDLLLQSGRLSGAAMYSIDPAGSRPLSGGLVRIRLPAEEALPELVAELCGSLAG